MIYLFVAIVVLALAGSAHAQEHRNHQCLDKNGDFVACPVPKVQTGDSIGWVKSSDIICGEDNTCSPKDNYTDAQKNGALCATFVIPVYSRPNGAPIGELFCETIVVRGEQHHGYTFISYEANDHSDHPPLLPYNPKDLHQCG